MDSILSVCLILFPNKYNYFPMGFGSVSVGWVKQRLLCPGFLVVVILVAQAPAHGQQTAAYDNPLLTYQQGIELYDKEKYGVAQQTFTEAIEGIDDPNSNISTDTSFSDNTVNTEWLYPGDIIEFIDIHLYSNLIYAIVLTKR